MKPTHEQAAEAIKAIIKMINARGEDIGDYVEHFSSLRYDYKTSLGSGHMSNVSVNEKAMEGLNPDEETLTLIRENFEYTEEDEEE